MPNPAHALAGIFRSDTRFPGLAPHERRHAGDLADVLEADPSGPTPAAVSRGVDLQALADPQTAVAAVRNARRLMVVWAYRRAGMLPPEFPRWVAAPGVGKFDPARLPVPARA